jgi:hypothetical protein
VCAADLCVVRSRDRCGGLVVGVGVPLADVYLDFLGGRCRPNTVLAAAYDLKVFFTVVGKPPDQVRPADVLAFITARRTGRAGEHGVLQPVDPGGAPAGMSSATVLALAHPHADRRPSRKGANPETSLPAAQRRGLHAGGLARPLRHHHQGRDSDDLTGSDGFRGQLTTRT